MLSVITWFKGQNIYTQVVLTGLSVLIFTAGLFYITSSTMEGKANDSMKPYFKSDSAIQLYIDTLKRPLYLDSSYFKVLKLQHGIIASRKMHHFQLAIIFFKNYYGVTIVLMILSCIGGLVLFVLVNQGWANANVVLRSLFLTIAMVVTFCGFFPKVFMQEENFNGNMKRFMDYSKAQVEIVGQLSKLSNPLYPRVDIKNSDGIKPDSIKFYRSLDSIITVNNQKINDLSNYVFSIDLNEIRSIDQISQSFSNYQKAAVDSQNKNH